MRQVRSVRRTPVRALAYACILLTVGTVVVTTPGARAAADEGDAELRKVGLMRAPYVDSEGARTLPPLAVDQHNKIGFTMVNTQGVAMYDLERAGADRLPVIAQVPEGDVLENLGAAEAFDATLWAIDEAHERAFIRPGAGGCTNPASSLTVPAIDYRADADGHRQLRPYDFEIACRGEAGDIGALSFDTASGRLYLNATDPTHGTRRSVADTQGVGTKEDAGAALYVMQVDPGDGLRGEIEWIVDLRAGGCIRRDPLVQWVQRTPDGLLTYCYDPNPFRGALGLGSQGYVVKIPLKDGDPVRSDGEPAFIDPVTGIAVDAEVRRIPSLSGPVTPFADPVTGRALLLTSGRANGNAFWVFDPASERFVGAVTGGISDEPLDSNAFGFDPGRGRGYLLTAGGVLVAPVRRLPLPTGELVPVVTNPAREERFVPTYSGGLKNDKIGVVTDVAACGGCTRLFVPVSEAELCPEGQMNGDSNKAQGGRCPAWVVLEDHIANRPVPEPEDPDRATVDIDEAPGKTDRVVSGRGLVSGAQVIVTGGAPRTVDQSVPPCGPVPVFVAAPVQNALDQALAPVNGGCLASLALASGHRQLALSWADIDVGAGTGVSADASGVAVADQDAATDRELKRAGECHASTFESSTGIDPEETTEAINEQLSIVDAEACDGVQTVFRAATGDDLRRGTEGGTDEEPGTGFPVPAAHCFDAGNAPSEDDQPETREGLRGQAFASSVACDAAQSAAEAKVSGALVGLPDPADPVIAISGTASDATSELTAEGQVTTAVASAYGVRIGPLTIGEVRSVAVSRAQGRPDTAAADLTRLWCGVSFEGESAEDGCIDATSDDARRLIDATNQALGRVRISVPAALEEATPGGFQAVVTKDPDQRGADQAVNDDDSHTVSGMQVTVFNDGAQGRNRYIVQLAGVHTEARYGIVLLPQFTNPTFEAPDFSPRGAALTNTQPGTPGTPGRVVIVEELVGGSGAGDALGRPEAPESPFRQVVESPVQAARMGLRWLWNNPGEAVLLSLLWSVLATPVYLGSRRRAFERVLSQHLQNQEPLP